MRRMILVLAAAALMAAMMALSALPALAAAPHQTGPPLVECERLADIGSEFAPLAKQKIRLLTPEVDISEVMEGVSKVLDESISARKSASSCSDTPRNVFPCLIVL